MNDRLRKRTPVRVLKHRPGWRGRIHSSVRIGKAGPHYYSVYLTHDADGERLAYKHIDGLYARRELEALTDSPQQGSPLSPTIQGKDAHFLP
jgi:hypothetical protein